MRTRTSHPDLAKSHTPAARTRVLWGWGGGEGVTEHGNATSSPLPRRVGTEKSRQCSDSLASLEPPPRWRRSFQPDTLSRPTPQPKGYNRRGRGSVEVSQNDLQPDSSSLKVHGGGDQKLLGLGLTYLVARPRLLGAGGGVARLGLGAATPPTSDALLEGRVLGSREIPETIRESTLGAPRFCSNLQGFSLRHRNTEALAIGARSPDDPRQF